MTRTKSETEELKLVTANPYHRHPLRVRGKPRKKFRSGPVSKKTPYGRCRMTDDGNWVRYT